MTPGTNGNGNALTFKWLAGISGTIVMFLVALLVSSVMGSIRDHEVRIVTLEKASAVRQEQIRQIRESLYRLESHFNTLPDTLRVVD